MKKVSLQNANVISCYEMNKKFRVLLNIVTFKVFSVTKTFNSYYSIDKIYLKWKHSCGN